MTELQIAYWLGFVIVWLWLQYVRRYQPNSVGNQAIILLASIFWPVALIILLADLVTAQSRGE